MAGLFLSMEGIDGSGKTTQLGHLEKRLRKAGIAYLINREPGGVPVGQQIRDILLNPANHSLSPTAELLLYFANRAQNVDEQVRPALERGEMVISDRFTDSTLAYQGAARGLGRDTVRTLHEIACRGTEPTLTIYLRVSLEVSARRRAAQVKDRLEAEAAEFHRRVFETYEHLAESQAARVVAVDGERSESRVAQEIWEIVNKAWEKRDR